MMNDSFSDQLMKRKSLLHHGRIGQTADEKLDDRGLDRMEHRVHQRILAALTMAR